MLGTSPVSGQSLNMQNFYSYEINLKFSKLKRASTLIESRGKAWPSR
jgi:hypothetical protein